MHRRVGWGRIMHRQVGWGRIMHRQVGWGRIMHRQVGRARIMHRQVGRARIMHRQVGWQPSRQLSYRQGSKAFAGGEEGNENTVVVLVLVGGGGCRCMVFPFTPKQHDRNTNNAFINSSFMSDISRPARTASGAKHEQVGCFISNVDCLQASASLALCLTGGCFQSGNHAHRVSFDDKGQSNCFAACVNGEHCKTHPSAPRPPPPAPTSPHVVSGVFLSEVMCHDNNINGDY